MMSCGTNAANYNPRCEKNLLLVMPPKIMNLREAGIARHGRTPPILRAGVNIYLIGVESCARLSMSEGTRKTRTN